MRIAKLFYKFVFTHEFLRFLLLDRVQLNKDNLILITGRRGAGKSTFAIKMAMGFNDVEKLVKQYNTEMNKKLEEPIEHKIKEFEKFNFDRDIVFGKDKLQNLCENSRRGFIVSDESIGSVGRRGSMTKTNKLLHKVLTINRKNCNTIFFLLPSIEDLDLAILQYVSMWVHIDDRGLGVIMLPNKPSVFGRKSWDIDNMKKIYEKFCEKNPRVTSVPYWLFDNFRGYIKFGKLKKDVEERYLELAHTEKNKETEEARAKVKTDTIGDEKRELIKDIAKKLINKEITDSADYYKYCGELEFKKDKLNRAVNDALNQMGEGRTSARIISENKVKFQKKQYDESREIKLY